MRLNNAAGEDLFIETKQEGRKHFMRLPIKEQNEGKTQGPLLPPRSDLALLRSDPETRLVEPK